ncbi:toll-like receptor 2 [Gymnodraco acuticeps]|uniref:Toll-like receptor 2 n=1 Tax=Gymnodraco acuticeps TaxID=8218 RepID=A0A6P8WIX2_GYMAC|nr:toll-like receptor 2 [Gymnodraco acuticeps]
MFLFLGTNMRFMTFLMCVLLLMHQSIPLSRPQCHSCEQTSCKCSRQNLTTVPAAPSKLITGLDLSFNRLQTITKDDFVAFASLQSLILNNNRIHKIQEQAFVPLTDLQKLDLSFNRLDSLSAGWFESLASLQSLNLLGNKYKMLGRGNLFQPLKKLKILHIGGPDLQSVGNSDFSGLSDVEEVVFDGNNLLSYTKGSLRQIGPIKYVSLGLNDSKLLSHAVEEVLSPPQIKSFEVVVLKNVDIPEFYSIPTRFLLNTVKAGRRLSVINCKLFLIPCTYSAFLLVLEYLDVSDNLLSDIALSQMMCDGNGGYRRLQTLNISRNHLQSINSQLFTKLERLKNIDMSGNTFQAMPETCYWPLNLQFLNLSSTHLTKVTPCLPLSLHILDLSDNDLTVFNMKLPFLTELYISSNKISSLPDGRLYPLLAFLSIRNNNLQTFSSKNLNDYNNLSSLEAGTNTYVCSCDFLDLMRSGLTNHQVTFVDGLKSYVCDSPDAVRGKIAADARLSVFECHTALASSLLCSGILLFFLLVVGLCHKFSVVWYMRMTWAWLRAKRKPKLKKGELEYDAFVSYSEMDSGWVEAHLVPELEQVEPRLRLCLHKRDFVPGGWILDNIMDAIEKSHRTLFVLSQNFIRSEWCKYELDYTHFRLFDHNDDTVVLILLEPIDKETVPKKFCKLRRVMNSRTYLEWPEDHDQIPRFWHSLRTAIKKPETVNGNVVQFDNVELI